MQNQDCRGKKKIEDSYKKKKIKLFQEKLNSGITKSRLFRENYNKKSNLSRKKLKLGVTKTKVA